VPGGCGWRVADLTGTARRTDDCAMSHWGVALTCALGMASGCARVQPLPLQLPSRDAPIEQRIVAYRRYAAMPHVGMNGWAMRIGNGPVGSLTEDRPYLANAREAEDALHARDNQLSLGWAFMGTGLAVTVVSLVVGLVSLRSIGTDHEPISLVPSAVAMGGTLIALPGAFIIGDAQRRVPPAAEAYNRWLWRALTLPNDVPAP